MSTPQLEERIAQFRKMAEDDPDNELAIELVHLAADGFDVESLGH